MGENSGVNTPSLPTPLSSLSKAQQPARSWTGMAVEKTESTEKGPEETPEKASDTQAKFAPVQVSAADAASLLDEQQQKLRDLEFKLKRFKENRSDDASNGKDVMLAEFLESVKAKISSLDTEVEIITQQYGKDGTTAALPVPAEPPSSAGVVRAMPHMPVEVLRQTSAAIRHATSPTPRRSIQRALSTPQSQRIISPPRSISRMQSRPGSPGPPLQAAEAVVLGPSRLASRAGSPGDPHPMEAVVLSSQLIARPAGHASPAVANPVSARSVRVGPGMCISPRALSPPTPATPSYEGAVLTHRGLSATASSASQPATPGGQQFRDMSGSTGLALPLGMSTPNGHPIFRDVPSYMPGSIVAPPEAVSASFSTASQMSRISAGSKNPIATGKFKDLTGGSHPQTPSTSAPASAVPSAAPSTVPSVNVPAADAQSLRRLNSSKSTPQVIHRQVSSAQQQGSAHAPNGVARQVSAQPNGVSRQISAQQPPSLYACPVSLARASYGSSVGNSPLGSASLSGTTTPHGSVSIPAAGCSSPGVNRSGNFSTGHLGSASLAASGHNSPNSAASISGMGSAGGFGGVGGFSSLAREPSMTGIGSSGARSPAVGGPQQIPFASVRPPVVAMPAWPPQAAAQAHACLPVLPGGTSSLEISRDAARERRRSRRKTRSESEDRKINDFSPAGRLAPIDDDEEGLGDHVLKFQEKIGRMAYDDRRFI